MTDTWGPVDNWNSSWIDDQLKVILSETTPPRELTLHYDANDPSGAWFAQIKQPGNRTRRPVWSGFGKTYQEAIVHALDNRTD